MPDSAKEYFEKGYKLIAGVDEVGRGPLAGPVCAAAVILPPDLIIEGVDDSKKLTEKKREKLYDIIIEKAIACAAVFAFSIANSTFSGHHSTICPSLLMTFICIIPPIFLSLN